MRTAILGGQEAPPAADDHTVVIQRGGTDGGVTA